MSIAESPVLALPEYRLGAPLRGPMLAVIPLYAEPVGAVDYLLAPQAFAEKSLAVQEVSEGGSVPELQVVNSGPRRVLFVEGEELLGAKQNRVLNTSVLVAAGATLKIPVSCVERGRWRHTSPQFSSSDSGSSLKLRKMMRDSVSDSTRRRGSHRSDQSGVWNEVDKLHNSLGVESATGALYDTFAAHRERVDEVRHEIAYPEGAVGLVAFVDNQLAVLDVFDKPQACGAAWPRLVSGLALEALDAEAHARRAGRSDPAAASAPARDEACAQALLEQVEGLLRALPTWPWHAAPAVGEGDERRAATNDGHAAVALSLGDVVLHASVLPRRD